MRVNQSKLHQLIRITFPHPSKDGLLFISSKFNQQDMRRGGEKDKINELACVSPSMNTVRLTVTFAFIEANL